MKPATLLLAFAASAVAEEVAVTPIQKVLSLMNTMLETAKTEKQEELVAHTKYDTMAEDTIAEKTRLIADYKAEMEAMSAKAISSEAAANAADEDAAEAKAHFMANEAEMKKLRAQREAEHKEFVKQQEDYMESVDALDRAIKVLNEQPKKVAQASLLELANHKKIPQESMKVITAFLAADPQAHGYENASGGVIDMMENLKSKFQEELDTLNTEEANAAHTFNMIIQDLTGENNAEKAQENHSLKLASEARQAKADADKAFTQAQDSKNSDTEFMNNLKAEHAKKTADFEEAQQLRGEEIVAIQKAIDIIGSKAVSGAPDAGLFAQFASITKGINVQQLKAAQFLRAAAARSNSNTLSTLAVRISDSPMDKVIKMINELIARLHAEAAEEAEHMGWCNTELSKNEATRKEKTNEIIAQTAKFDKNTATIARLNKEISEHNDDISETQKALAEATDLRNKESAANKKTVDEAKAAQSAVADAIAVLQAFYQKANESSAYSSGNQGGGQSVLGMLEVIQSDFARLEAETEKAEENATQLHSNYETESESNIAKNQAQVESKTGAMNTATADKADAKNDRERAQKSLDLANQELEKLRPTCIDAGSSHSERMQSRQDEIQSLKEALEILEDHDSA